MACSRSAESPSVSARPNAKTRTVIGFAGFSFLSSHQQSHHLARVAIAGDSDHRRSSPAPVTLVRLRPGRPATLRPWQAARISLVMEASLRHPSSRTATASAGYAAGHAPQARNQGHQSLGGAPEARRYVATARPERHRASAQCGAIQLTVADDASSHLEHDAHRRAPLMRLVPGLSAILERRGFSA